MTLRDLPARNRCYAPSDETLQEELIRTLQHTQDLEASMTKPNTIGSDAAQKRLDQHRKDHP